MTAHYSFTSIHAL